MATSLQPIFLPANTWVDIYAALNAQAGVTIPVGTQLNAHNPETPDVYLTEASSQPTALQGNPSSRTVGISLLQRGRDRQNQSGAVGAWAFSFEDTVIQVERA